jgi:hypothetical protein
VQKLESTLEPAGFSHAEFQDCCMLDNINIPNNISEIHCNAFYGCVSLQRLVMPSKISFVHKFAFGIKKTNLQVIYNETHTKVMKEIIDKCKDVVDFRMEPCLLSIFSS